jgi:hypothetical protein
MSKVLLSSWSDSKHDFIGFMSHKIAVPEQETAILGDYVTRWRRWSVAGLCELQASLLLSSVARQPETG